MPKLTQSITRQNKYQLGGLVALIAWPTRLDNGLPGATITRASLNDGQGNSKVTNITLEGDNAAYVLGFKPNEATWTGGTQFGNNTYIKPTLALKLEGLSDEANAAKKAFDLGTHTFLAKDKNGRCILLGEVNGLEAEKSDVSGGGKNDDFSGYDILLSGGETEPVPPVPVSVFEALLAAISEAEG